MPGLTGRRRTRNSSGELLIAPNIVEENNKRARMEVEEDPELLEAIDDRSVLCRTLKQCGLVIRKGATPNLLYNDQEVFLKKFKREMTILPRDQMEEVKATLEGWLDTSKEATCKEDRTFLKKCLQPTVTSASCNTARSGQQESLMRLLLNTPDTQTHLLRKILEQLALISLDEEEMLQSQHSQIPRLILTATRWLNRIEEEDGLTQALIDIMIGCSSFIQVEVISALPEILPDSQHPTMAVHLNTMLDEQVRPHTATIVDCLANLTLSRESTKQVREGVLRRLPTISQPDLPAVLDFLLATIVKDEAVEVISEIRGGIDLTRRMEASQRQAKGSEQRRQEEGAMSVERLVLDKIRVTVARERWLGDAWLEAVKTGAEGLCLDLLVMVLMYKMPRHSKAVEAIMKTRAKAGLLESELVSTTMAQHKESISHNIESVIALAECALVSREEEVASLGVNLFSEAFRKLGGGSRQELVIALVSKASQGPGEGRVASLKMLATLVEGQGEEVGQYAVFLTQLLDYLDTFEQSEVEVVMKVLCGLAWGGGSRGEGIRDQLVITVKKQLYSYNEAVQRLGVVGAVAAIGAMLKLQRKEQGELSLPLAESSRSSSAGPQLGGLQGEAKELLNTARSRADRSAGVSTLLIETLERLVRSDQAISKDFLSRLQGDGDPDTSLAQVFENEYFPEIDQEKEARLHFPVETRYSLEDQENDSMEQDPPAVVHILTLGASLHGIPGVSASGKVAVEPQVLASRLPCSLRLLCTVSQRLEGGLKEVDALASCGLRMPSLASTEDLTTVNRDERALVLNSLFLAYNWMVEVINAFSKNEEAEKEVVVARLRHLLEVRDQLRAGLRHCPGFRPPVAGGLDTSAWNLPLAKMVKARGKGGKGKKGRKGKKPTEQTMNATLHLNTQSPLKASLNQQAVTLAQPPSVDFAHYQPFLRHLDLPALLALISSGALNLERNDDSGLRVQELLFLLADLRQQLQGSLATVAKAFPGGGRGRPGSKAEVPSVPRLSPQEVAEIVLPEVKYVAAHMDNIAKHFQQLIDLQDGIVDGAEMCSPTSLLLASCMEEGLMVFHLLITSPHMRSFLPSVFASLSPNTRFNSSPPTSSLMDLANCTLTHLSSTVTHAAITPSVAASHLKLLTAVATHASSSSLVSKVAASYLRKDWRNEEGEREKGSKFGKQVEAMLGVFLEGSQPLERVGRIQDEGIVPVLGESKESETWPAISRSTIAVVYKALLTTLVNEAKKVVFNPRTDQDSQFSKWDKLVGLFNRLTDCLKKWRNLAMLAALLKLGRRFLEHFTKHGVPLVEKLFTGGMKRRTGCIQLIKVFQQSTRYMQTVCCHSKLTASVSLANHVPLVKRALEVFVYRAKAMLAANDCSDAFSLGTLVNRDLQGDQLQLSQVTVEDEDEGEEEEEEDQGEEEEGEEESDGEGVGAEEQNSRVREIEDISHMSEEY